MTIKAVGPRCVGYVLKAPDGEHWYCVRCAIKYRDKLRFDRAIWAEQVSRLHGLRGLCSQCGGQMA